MSGVVDSPLPCHVLGVTCVSVVSNCSEYWQPSVACSRDWLTNWSDHHGSNDGLTQRSCSTVDVKLTDMVWYLTCLCCDSPMTRRCSSNQQPLIFTLMIEVARQRIQFSLW